MTADLLTAHQREVSARVLAEESSRREHLCISLSGAHAYGFPSPDSDLDLKAIHVAATRELLGLEKPRASFDRLEVIDGVEIDYTSNELQMALAGVLTGNGNYLERILGSSLLQESPLLASLRPVVQRSLCRRVHHHYRGFAGALLHDAEQPGATAKQVLYVLRTALTATHLLRTGALVADLGALCDDYGFADARVLIAQKRAGERVVLSESDRQSWLARLATVMQTLDAARERSILPEEPPNAAELEAWLIDVRRQNLR